MAENLLFKITMLTDKTQGDPSKTWLDVGGQFASYYNDVTGALVVRDLADNTIKISSAFPFPTVLQGNVDFTSEPAQIFQNGLLQADATYSVCVGADLKHFMLQRFISHPFATARLEPAHFSCAGFSCDLLISNTSVVNESIPGAADGQITITATSSLSIQYGLADFDYGAGQTSPIFSGLIGSTYTVYAVDSNQCKQNITVVVNTIGIDDYGLLYRIGYQDLNGNNVRFDVKKISYAGASSEITSSSVPVRYVSNEVDQFDPFSGIRPSYVTVTIPELTKFGYRELYTTNSREYLGVWSKDTGAGYVELWRGFLVPEVFSTSYTYVVDLSLTFVDGLAKLTDNKYADGQIVFSDMKLIDVVAKALETTDLELPINVAINIYENSHNTAATDDPLAQTYIDQETFYDDDELMSYHEVLETKILKPFGAKLLQWGGAWWVIRQEECLDNFDYRTFDKDGVYVSNSTYSPQKSLELSSVTTARAVWSGENATYEILPPAREVLVTNTLGLRLSLLENYSFELSQSNTPLFWTLVLGNSTITGQVTQNGEGKTNAYRFNNVQWSNNIKVAYLNAISKNIQYTSGDRFKFSLDVAVDSISKAFPYMIIRARIKVGTNYLLEDGSWTTTDSVCRFYPSPKNGYQEVSIEADFPITNVVVDTTLDVRVYDYQAKNPDFGEYSNVAGLQVLQDGEAVFRAFATVGVPLDAKYSVYANLEDIFYLYFFTLKESTDAESLPGIVRPDDYNGTTNTKVWKLDETVKIDAFDRTGTGFDLLTAQTNRYFYIDNIVVNVLPNGQETAEEQLIKVPINDKFINDNKFEIAASDLPQTYISSGKYIYNSFFKLSDGSNTQNWTRDGVAESQTIQQILAKVLTRQHSTPSNKITGTLTTLNRGGAHMDITPLDCLVETQDSDTIYYINGLQINDKELTFQVSLMDSKATLTDGGGAGGNYSGDYNADYGGDFATIFN